MTTTTWNQAGEGNAHVSDGQEGYWSDFPSGTTAAEVLTSYMSTANYSAATKEFVVTAEIDGATAECTVSPGGSIAAS